MSEERASSKTCQKVIVPPEACYVRLVGPAHKVKNTGDIGYTSDGDWVLVDYDDDGKIVGLELIGDGKPCQLGGNQR